MKPSVYNHYRQFISDKYCLSKFFADIFTNLHLRRLSIFFNDIFHKGIQLYLKKNYLTYIENFSENDIEVSPSTNFKQNSCIFVCWLQGIENAPEIVKYCYKKLLENSNGHEVILITKENILNTVHFPNYIMDKLEKGIISYTYFSDLLRTALLYCYGGIWIDATVFLTTPIDNNIFSFDFFSIKKNNYSPYYIPKGKWAIYFIAGKKECRTLALTNHLLCSFWKQNDIQIDYFLTDHIINFCYENDRIVKSQIDSIPVSNNDVDFFKNRYDAPFEPNRWKQATKNTSIFKLSWKEKINTEKQGTWFSEVIKK